jgi:hypothetical protein
VIRWLMSDARKRVDPSEFLQTFADELCAAGLDVSRVTHGRQGWRHFRRIPRHVPTERERRRTGDIRAIPVVRSIGQGLKSTF